MQAKRKYSITYILQLFKKIIYNVDYSLYIFNALIFKFGLTKADV